MTEVIRPQPGPQAALLACPANEILFGGARGGGKSYGLLLDWIAHMTTYPQHARGIIFRKTYPELSNIIDESLMLLPKFGGRYMYTQKTWFFPGGAMLRLRQLERDSDATRYQGHQYTYIGLDEAGAWATPSPLWKLKATLRNVHGIPSRMVLTGNPGGAGQVWLKERYIAGMEPYKLIPDEDDDSWLRTYIPSRVWDNQILLKSDPNYISRLRQVGNDALVAAWLEGDWDSVPGMFLEGVWDASRHVVEPFEIPVEWRRFRSLDWGYAKPYSVNWWAQDFDGKLFMYREMYGKGPHPNTGSREEAQEVAKRIVAIEEREKLQGIKFRNNPADTSIWMRDGRFRAINDIFYENGVQWAQASKGADSRVNGAQEVVSRLRGDTLAVFSNCKYWLQTVPSIPSDPLHIEDVDTDAEDHAWDSTRYGIMSRRPKSRKPGNEVSAVDTFDWVATPDGKRGNPMRRVT